MKPVLLCICDGFALAPATPCNAIAAANTPVLDNLFASCPSTQISASGLAVGLPEGQMGNSEVGHTNIGAGRVVYQSLTRITKSITDGDFFTEPTLIAAVNTARENGGALHIMGLYSDGGVHSHLEHMHALLRLAAQQNAQKVLLHLFMDGRDVSPTSGAGFIEALEELLKNYPNAEIATVCGRFYAMDRDNRWERVEKAYAAIAKGEGARPATSASEYLHAQYAQEITDEFIEPAVFGDGQGVKQGESIVFFNFRPDRAREITRTFVDDDFSGFARGARIPVNFFCFTEYDASMPNVDVVFPPQALSETLGEIVSANGLRQLRIAETEKYAHVTFFFNGGVETLFEGEERVLVPSPKVATYDLQPEMSAPAVAQKLVEEIEKNVFDLIVLNFANCDMVGHTGVFAAAVKAAEAVDEALGKVLAAVDAAGGVAVVTADHGNAEKMCTEDGDVFTAHTTSPVPVAITNYPCTLRGGGALCDLAPTILEIMGIAKPAGMQGESLVVPK